MTLQTVMKDKPLSRAESRKIVTDMMEGKYSNEEMAAILAILAYRGESPEEISGFAQGMIDKATNISLPYELLDTCGTGGDSSHTYNVSTASAILLSSMGVKVAKHGNRSVSSKTGSADVLEIMNIPFQANIYEAETALKDHSLSFFFAPMYHEAMKFVAPVRKALKQRTIFNILGPLTNPAKASRRIIGVYNLETARKMAEASLSLPISQALFVTGEDGLDEITVQGKTHIIELRNGEIREYTITPEDVGLTTGSLSETLVYTPEQSARMIQDIFNKRASAAATDLLLINAGAALYIADHSPSIKSGVEAAREALGDSVQAHLNNLQQKGAGSL
ncbi:anthranilate phosphoribosyltransferase [Alkalicoccus daliensis]|uniref:Anthranilate phosphoribosyltransferase n=1 Tax=Alkalicoccus daliensis TaxID=745820 RepID=A0A1H0AV40_9BACI|nr:anthranilate phosphoribosyltransferase [Alkalicoccus daliensis]SDN37244.1 anthranilate phosphoribosyltransferase [Alkalicoccus daliensis]